MCLKLNKLRNKKKQKKNVKNLKALQQHALDFRAKSTANAKAETYTDYTRQNCNRQNKCSSHSCTSFFYS